MKKFKITVLRRQSFRLRPLLLRPRSLPHRQLRPLRLRRRQLHRLRLLWNRFPTAPSSLKLPCPVRFQP